MTRRLEHTVSPDEAGSTVGHLARASMHLTRHAVSRAKYIDDGITLDGERVFTDRVTQAGQVISVVIGDTEQDVEDSFVVPNAGPLAIVYEDEDLLVIDKPAGLVMHPGPGHYDDTLGNRVVAHLGQREGSWTYHPVHRLDKGTSGLVVVATSATVQHRLTKNMHTQEFLRAYLACCDNAPTPAKGRIELPIATGKDGHSWHVSEEGKPAITDYEVISQPPQTRVALVRCTLLTGRTHQIRIHLSSMGCPIIGDELYGQADSRISRPALHSAHLELVHPITGQHLSFDSPLPKDMAELL